MKLIPHQYQLDAIKHIQKHKAVFLMLDMGLGKTMVGLRAIRRMGMPALVFAPLRPALSTWPEELAKWTPELTHVILHGPKKDQLLAPGKDVYILPYSSMKWFFQKCLDKKFKLRKFFTIWDESSMFKDPSTQRFKMLKAMGPIFSDYKLCLSATPAPGGLENLWSQYYMLDSGKRLGKTMKAYTDKYFNVTGPPMWQTRILPGAEEIIHKTVNDISYRLEDKDYLDMPSITYNKIGLNLTPALKKRYDTLKKDFIQELEASGKNAVMSQGVLSGKLRQFLQGGQYIDGGPEYEPVHKLKLNALKEVMDTSAGQPVLCPIQFRFEYDMIRKELGYDAPIVYGGTSTKLGIQYVKAWNRGELPLLLCHPASLGHGMNLQSGGNIVLWYGLPFSLDQFMQLNGRLYRQGQMNGVMVNALMINNSIDDHVWEVLRKKNVTQRDLLSALKGV